MNNFLLIKAATSLRTPMIIGILTIVIVCAMPIVAVMAIARTSLITLAASAIDELYQGAVSKTDTYDWGNCTYWAALLRQQAGDPIPNTWGNAATWASRAANDGYFVNHTPAVGAIMQIANVDNGHGHVAYVTSVDAATGSWTISEMNVIGFDIVDTKTLPASADITYNFIHDQLPSQ